MGWTGALRAPLRPPGSGTPNSAGDDPRIAAIDELLPGVQVRRHGFGRRVVALRATAPTACG